MALEATGEDHLIRQAIRAIGLAALGQKAKSPELVQRARQQYGITLALTNSFVVRSTPATHGELLAAVLLLVIFETVICDGMDSNRRWHNHIQGAIALMKLIDKRTLFLGPQLFRVFRRLYVSPSFSNPRPRH